jgi:hypothetical protein
VHAGNAASSTFDGPVFGRHSRARGVPACRASGVMLRSMRAQITSQAGTGPPGHGAEAGGGARYTGTRVVSACDTPGVIAEAHITMALVYSSTIS